MKRRNATPQAVFIMKLGRQILTFVLTEGFFFSPSASGCMDISEGHKGAREQLKGCDLLTKKKAERRGRRRKGGLLATCGLHNAGTNHRGTWQLE